MLFIVTTIVLLIFDFYIYIYCKSIILYFIIYSNEQSEGNDAFLMRFKYILFRLYAQEYYIGDTTKTPKKPENYVILNVYFLY